MFLKEGGEEAQRLFDVQRRAEDGGRHSRPHQILRGAICPIHWKPFVK